MRKINLLMALSFTVVLLFAFKAGEYFNTDFSGTWKININKTVPKELANKNSAALTMKVKQSKEQIFFERQFSFSTEIVSESLSFDGKISESMHQLPNSIVVWQKKTYARWSFNKSVLMLVSKYRTENNGIVQEFERKENYTLSGDKSELKVERITVLNNKKDSIRVVYDRE